jgi:hypothetical protein
VLERVRIIFADRALLVRLTICISTERPILPLNSMADLSLRGRIRDCSRTRGLESRHHECLSTLGSRAGSITRSSSIEAVMRAFTSDVESARVGTRSIQRTGRTQTAATSRHQTAEIYNTKHKNASVSPKKISCMRIEPAFSRSNLDRDGHSKRQRALHFEPHHLLQALDFRHRRLEHEFVVDL